MKVIVGTDKPVVESSQPLILNPSVAALAGSPITNPPRIVESYLFC